MSMTENIPLVETPPVVETPPAGEVEGGGEGEGQETFKREYVEKIRREAAGYRTQLKEFEDAFSGYEPEERKALLDITKQLANPSTQPAAATRLRSIAERIIEAHEGGASGVRPDGSEDPSNKPLTRKEYEELERSKGEKAERDAAVKQVVAEAERLGFKEGSLEFTMLLHEAQEPGVNGDLAKAAEKVAAFKQGVVDEYAKGVQENGTRFPPIPGSQGTPPGEQPKTPKTFPEARKMALAYMEAEAGKV